MSMILRRVFRCVRLGRRGFGSTTSPAYFLTLIALMMVFMMYHAGIVTYTNRQLQASSSKSVSFHSRIVNPEDVNTFFFLTREEEKRLRESQENQLFRPAETAWKKILYWNQDFSDDRYYGIGGVGNESFRRNGCPVWQCQVFDYLDLERDESLQVGDFDAVVFHDPTWGRDFEVPTRRSPHQRYVFWSQESPAFRVDNQLGKLDGFFNWTMTYRWDSDIVHPYGWMVPLNSSAVPMNPEPAQLKGLLAQTRAEGAVNYAKGKSRLVAWIVSHCDSAGGRDDYVQRLKEYVDVDIYGKCGKLQCNRSDDGACRRMVERDYKFYIAMENSYCLDYMTEKLFEQIHYNYVLIVVDLHGNHAQFAPPHSYINAADFPTVKDLAEYLNMLDQDDALYNEYFWWRSHYQIRNSPEDFRHGLCQFCSMLHRPSQEVKIYDSMVDWWDNQSQCKSIRFPSKAGQTEDPYIWTAVPYPQHEREAMLNASQGNLRLDLSVVIAVYLLSKLFQ